MNIFGAILIITLSLIAQAQDTPEEISLTYEETLPTVEETSPTAEETSPTVEEILPPVKEALPTVEETSPTLEETLLTFHNDVRAPLGLYNYTWSDSLAEVAQEWAEYLASNTLFEHSTYGYGENIAYGRGKQKTNLPHLFNYWYAEIQYYIPDQMFPDDVSTTSNWYDVAHYTQIVWDGTREIGCATAIGPVNGILVCEYYPPGNRFGSYVY